MTSSPARQSWESDVSTLGSGSNAATVQEAPQEVKERSDIEIGLPTEEEERTLRRIVVHPSWYVYLICFIELAERASYYGTGDRLNNYYTYPLPEGGNGAGATAHGSEANSGALGKGLATATSLGLLLKFTSYFFPLVTGYLCDMYMGHVRTLWYGIWTGVASHIIFILSALPVVLKHPDAAMALSLIGLITLSVCTAFVKPVLLPLLLQQYPHETNVVKTLETGERVIIDRDASLQRMTMTFYWAINIGAFMSLATSYAAKEVGFWLAFLIPLIIYMAMPVVFSLVQPHIKDRAPSGYSLLADCMKVLYVAFGKGWNARRKEGVFWDYALPSNQRQMGKVGWRKKSPFYKESLVQDTKITLSACFIFCYYIIYNMNDNQLTTIINSQTGSMTKNGVPNDVISNFNPLSIIVLIPILDYGLYPLLRRLRINFKPVYRIFTGFMLAVASSVAGALIQWRIYETSSCGYHATTCSEKGLGVSPLSSWIVAVEYTLSGASECLAMTTAYEIAYDRSPEHMKSFVLALFLFTSAVSAAITQIVNPILKDPLLIVPFALFAGIGFISGCHFLWKFRNLDKEMLQEKRERELLQESSESDELEVVEIKDVKGSRSNINGK
ncbi:Ptr2p Ecym_2823 [Eremothecium cymbalariae DBVPG|uniref:Peptide transporter PTR2 n=1 Tax=Eremothecium cymbalariae (strain CBS 270.75 / DBVPG 7215 / KCTC 17166 / NRRL Y-17582) TaxID=931890 RepID=G8JQF6_ERECY|nr:Hypothetical protein Ecym_2823 [Eremothecium cymbalariae DBVPG\